MKIYGVDIIETQLNECVRWEYTIGTSEKKIHWVKQQKDFKRSEMIQRAKETILTHAHKVGISISLLDRIKTLLVTCK